MRRAHVWDCEPRPLAFTPPYAAFGLPEDGDEFPFSLFFTVAGSYSTEVNVGAYTISYRSGSVLLQIRASVQQQVGLRLRDALVDVQQVAVEPQSALVDGGLPSWRRRMASIVINVHRTFFRVAVCKLDGRGSLYCSSSRDDVARTPQRVTMTKGKVCDIVVAPLVQLRAPWAPAWRPQASQGLELAAFRTMDSFAPDERSRGRCDVLDLLGLRLDDCERIDAHCAEAQLCTLFFMALRVSQANLALKCVWSGLTALPSTLLAELRPPPPLYIRALERQVRKLRQENSFLKRKLGNRRGSLGEAPAKKTKPVA